MIAWACVGIGASVVALVVLILIGRGDRLTCPERLGLAAFAAGLVWAGPQRALGGPVGPGDALMLIGVAVFIAATRGHALWVRIDRLDGARDQRVDVTKLFR